MTKIFFGRNISIGELQIDKTNTSSESDSIRQRLGRIEENYGRLELVLSEIEMRLTEDKINEILGRDDLAVISESANPKKPR